MSRSERITVGLALWSSRSVAVVNQQAVGVGNGGVQGVYEERTGVLDATPTTLGGDRCNRLNLEMPACLNGSGVRQSSETVAGFGQALAKDVCVVAMEHSGPMVGIVGPTAGHISSLLAQYLTGFKLTTFVESPYVLTLLTSILLPAERTLCAATPLLLRKLGELIVLGGTHTLSPTPTGTRVSAIAKGVSEHGDTTQNLELATQTALPIVRSVSIPVVRPDISTLSVVEEPPYRDLICSYGWHCPTAERIIQCESRFDPEAISWDGQDFGLMQINAETWAPVFSEFWTRWMEPEWNVKTGYEIYKRAGYSFSDWECW